MIIELIFHDRNRPSEFREIARTELNAPNVLRDREGNFFAKVPVDNRISTTVEKYLAYHQCRGEELSSIEIVRRPTEAEEVA